MEEILELIALLTIIFGVNIPLFWIPVHLKPKFFRKIGILTYLMPFITLSIISIIVYMNRLHLLKYVFEIPLFLNFLGLAIFLFGFILHLWTAKLLGFWGLIGVPEILTKKKSKFIASGPFSMVRHPTYLAHTLIFLGIFLFTEFVAVGILAFFDFVIVHALIIPLEEKELLSRFGSVYEEYKGRVRWRMLPWFI
ncbi:MAG: DUF1295 domain-containing protein [Thermodesulfovibrionales bacterium]|nr:DUF1295 domain-containing protein [Thermodesulfovibrionales bacterium]